ncbi:trypsin-like peptidase domain-containing protein [Luteolibacter pohnpeiensis]|uniref:Trypsin-like peptidase domain-containing protein n=1 Tax=Luteolibacter pohnpeiensis TaxID=454153 RepID=A0A934SD23_9BACT|nr:serine protease [Luteolibacter pohnpeiensis]MBK1883023.1 trypsin-like peptidase domain-containing protein [Luteolibacter pohnpeiensis]
MAPAVADPPYPGSMARQMVLERMSVVVVTSRSELSDISGSTPIGKVEPADEDGGSAAPLSPDGYFLTADHVLAQMNGRNVFVIFHRRGGLVQSKARVVWRSKSSDLALLHVPENTPYYYRWTSPNQLLPEGTPLIHGGISTGMRSAVGKLSTAIQPDGWLTGSTRFKIDIPLEPGDSGGPIVDGAGRLIGVNSAVEFLVPLETAFFVDSEGNRPNIRKIDDLIKRDRARNGL